MATSNRKSIPCKFGLSCNQGDACQYRHSERGANQHHNNRQDNIFSRPPSRSRRPPSGTRRFVPTPNVTPPGSATSHPKTYRHVSLIRANDQSSQKQPLVDKSNIQNNRWSRTRSRNCRSNSKDRCSNAIESIDNSLQLPLTMEQIKKIIEDLHQEDIPEAREKHELLLAGQISLLDDLDDEDTRPMIEALIQELKDQLEVFNTIIFSLSAFNPSTLLEAQNHFNALKREIKRLESHLPIYARRLDLISTISSNRVTIVKADTGSGKSTQLVQYLVDAGLADRGQIVCTQPRRLAARALASRVAEEFGCKVGDEVGFHIGASNPRVSDQTRIRFVTDAVLLNEYHFDRKLSVCSIVIVDEAHERRVDTDLLFGVLKTCLRERDDIKLFTRVIEENKESDNGQVALSTR